MARACVNRTRADESKEAPRMRNQIVSKPDPRTVVTHSGRWFWRVLIEQYGGAR